jgi:hypothetical protein
MTIIAALDFFQEIIVIGDTRVSYGDQFVANYGIKKLVVIGLEKIAVGFGFCGPILPAKKVIADLTRNPIKPDPKVFSIDLIHYILKLRIQESLVNFKYEEVKGLAFLFAAFDPHNLRPVYTDDTHTKLAGHVDFNQRYFIVYQVQEDMSVISIKPNARIVAIGSGKKEIATVGEYSLNLLNMGFNTPDDSATRNDRAYLISLKLLERFELIKSATVGGPFEVLRITRSGWQGFYAWGYPNKLEIQKGYPRKKITTVTNLETKEQRILLDPVAWMKLMHNASA